MAVTFDSTVFQGVSFDLRNTSEASLAEIQALPEVEKIWPARLITLPTISELEAGETDDVKTPWNPHKSTGVDILHENGWTGSDVIVAIVDTGIDYTHPALGGGFGSGFRVSSSRLSVFDGLTDVVQVEKGYDFVGDGMKDYSQPRYLF